MAMPAVTEPPGLLTYSQMSWCASSPSRYSSCAQTRVKMSVRASIPGSSAYGMTDMVAGYRCQTGPMPEPFEPNADRLIANNAAYAQGYADQDLVLKPRLQLAIVACMDSRMDMFQMLGLEHGDAHIIRNAGGVVTEDVIRSLVLSQRYVDTREIILIHHTDCA